LVCLRIIPDYGLFVLSIAYISRDDLVIYLKMADILPRLLSFPRRSNTPAVSDDQYDEQVQNFVACLKEYLPNKTSGGPETATVLEVSP
jgi:hypothetical protein